MIKRKVATFAMSVFILSSLASCLVAQDQAALTHATILRDYVTKDVVAVGYINLEKVNATQVVEYLHRLELIVDEEKGEATPVAQFADGQIDSLKKAGVSSIYVLLRVSDLASGGPSLVMPVAAGSDMEAASKAVRQVAENFPPLEFSVGEQVVYAAASKEQLNQLASDRPAEPRDLSEALKTISDGSAGLLVCGDDDSRRVVSGVFPAMPPPFEMVTGKLIAEKVEWASAELTLPTGISLEFEFEAKTKEGAKEIQSVLNQVVDALRTHPGFQSFLPANEQKTILNALVPSQSGKRVSVSLGKLAAEMDGIVASLAPQVRAVRQAARRSQEMNNLRQFALALLNYESAHQKFPRADGKSDEHPAGLSWRVHILPYIEQGNLYKQFRLNEPWDSEHNKALIKFMPPLFLSPMPEVKTDLEDGLTVYQVPFCKESIFQPNADTAGFRDVLDGTSNTMLVVSTAPDEAVVWTKPDDWDVDLADPLKGLKAEGREGANVVFCDGSVHWIPMTTSPKVVGGLVTRAGGEVTRKGKDGRFFDITGQ